MALTRARARALTLTLTLTLTRTLTLTLTLTLGGLLWLADLPLLCSGLLYFKGGDRYEI